MISMQLVRDKKVTTAGYQGTQAPNQWFGGPALSSSAGNMVLRDAAGNVVDGLNYGGLVDPWAAEGYQAASGAGESGCFVLLQVLSEVSGWCLLLPPASPTGVQVASLTAPTAIVIAVISCCRTTITLVAPASTAVQTILKSPV